MARFEVRFFYGADKLENVMDIEADDIATASKYVRGRIDRVNKGENLEFRNHQQTLLTTVDPTKITGYEVREILEGSREFYSRP